MFLLLFNWLSCVFVSSTKNETKDRIDLALVKSSTVEVRWNKNAKEKKKKERKWAHSKKAHFSTNTHGQDK